ncbi:MAG: hypothetical protein ABW061_07950 [Polyangiaceae bacterium]
MIWPEDLDHPLTANAQELSLLAMSTEVSVIMAQLAGVGAGGNIDKLRLSLENALTWLDEHIDPVLAALPSERQLSFLEVAAFCLVTHLSFRGLLSDHAVSQARRVQRAVRRTRPRARDALSLRSLTRTGRTNVESTKPRLG